MKPSILTLCLMFLACTLPAQTNLNASSLKVVSAGYTAKGGGIVEAGMLGLKGREITTADSLIKCHGECEMTIHNVTLNADELDFRPNTGEAEARGTVRVKLLPQGAAAAE
jgi:lipopolysaccharide assembly outer membrane protein LptD (OstA)